LNIVVREVDLDTALSALLLGFSKEDRVAKRETEATPEDLADSSVFCIECGGSGDVAHGNFDHHDPARDLPSACVQAWQAALAAGRPFDAQLQRLVDYVSILDTQGPLGFSEHGPAPRSPYPTLSTVFSGMRTLNPDAKEQLLKGTAILRTVLERGIDPFGTMPDLPEWRPYVEAKANAAALLREAMKQAHFFSTRTGRRAGTLSTTAPGALGALYARGCEIALAQSPGSIPRTWKYTIGATYGLDVSSLLPILHRLEQGWGGACSGTIIGSPHRGSRITLDHLCAIVTEAL
jgi:hypothetical protein